MGDQCQTKADRFPKAQGQKTVVRLFSSCKDQGEFRQDLYYRLNIISLVIPPLRKRIDDIVPLANYFLEEICRENGWTKILSAESYSFLIGYGWPGNVRELKNMMQELVVTCPDDVVLPEHLSLGATVPVSAPVTVPELTDEDFGFGSSDYHAIMRSLEGRMLKAAIERCGGNMAAASRMLKMDRSPMFRKMRELERHGIKIV